ncbi:type VI secretion system protein [Variovorax boronicumulans]|uniref:type VI secretion system protein n=1 Tax=Variovorax boronicumulans TaxID=436515 RepID=UPI00339171FC
MTTLLSPLYFFWTLVALCLVGFVLLYASVRDAGRGARRRGLLRRIEALAAPVDEATVDALRTSMAQARQALRHAPPPPARASHASHGSHAPAAPTPWFLFLGDAAAGLPGLFATAHAERPPPAGDEALGQTCWRWWLTDAAMGIEIHPDAVAEPADTSTSLHARGLWLQALLALADRRDRLPLNGLVVCFAANTLLRADAADAPATAARMRRLIDEAGDTLRLQLPVYLVVTGLQKLPGYATVRGALPPEVLAQVLGHRLTDPSASSPAGERLDAVFEPLALQLHALRMGLLRELPGAAGQLAIHSFVESVQALQPALREVAAALFDSHGKGSRAPRWRGLYLTASSSGATGGAFVHDLFGRFLPADQPLARPGRAVSSNAAAVAAGTAGAP